MDPGGASRRSSRSAETWRGHIIQQLKHRDRIQSAMFQDLIRFYTGLLEKTSMTKGLLSSSGRPPAEGCARSSLQQLKKTTGELAYKVVELQQQIKIKERVLQELQTRLQKEGGRLAEASEAKRALGDEVEQVRQKNKTLKAAYDALLQRQREAESKLREEKEKEERVLEDMMHQKKQAAARMNHRNERRSRARQATVQKQLQTAARSKVIVDSAPTSRSTSPKPEDQDKSGGRGATRLFRSASASSPRFFSSIREMFDRKRRGHSVRSLEEDLLFPVGICLSARVPVRPLQVLEAHEQGINAVRFSFGSDLLATGGTDRVIKLWDVRAGSLTHRATLDGSTEGITCVEFDHMGRRILAASHNKSALLWRLDDSVPKVTLTGHSRKVTAARFTCVPHQVVTGSTDRTVRLWDLNRAACVQQGEVASFCSDLVCSDSSIISGHFDCKIRVWDSRTVNCVQELPSQGRVTSLDLSSDRRQLLSCCRDDCLQLLDLRWTNDRMCFRADGFKCGGDSTKAVISPDGCYLAAGSTDGAVYIWNVSTGGLEARLPDQHSSSITAVSWSLSGEHFVSVDRSRRAVLWSDI
ncbi:PREDICTED: autophagy-related protein 16-2 isoform X2 [Poecilia mexicana]|uniref:ATG16 autophagy related 16-like 2 isoform X2 n=1 Tax=Poecilia formosa TaxID=48698 RepID=UPI000443F3D6|nr:PREDICTED: autophagy-related protein 16-2 isoform X2 [Poecilia formosa]XP_014862372.1 PREDICTED: autophagy-related protein 16-2 isoform X2 [Poecilia mexicana]